MYERSGRIGRFVAMLLAGACLPAQAWGQTEGDATTGAPAASEPGTPADIVVTAQRRTERLQDVPVSAFVASGESLQAAGVGSLNQATQTIPSVFVVRAGPADRLAIRGIGSGDSNPLFEQSVATFVDGIYRSRSRASQSTFLDISRVEVLKGPQSVYFGNNSIAGAFNITTRDPGESWDGYARALYNFNFNNATGEAAFGGPITDTLGIRVAGLYQHGDGWIRDENIGIRVPRVRNLAGRVTLLWRPTDNLSVNLKVQAERNRQTGGLASEFVMCPPSPLFPAGPGNSCRAALATGEDVLPNRTRSQSPGQGIDLDAQTYVGTVNYDAGPFSISSITGFYHHDFSLRLDVDGVGTQLANFTVPERFSQFSQELRITSQAGSAVDYMAGLYYEHDRLRGQIFYNFTQLNPAVVGPFAPLRPYLPFGQVDDFRQSTDVWGVFASVTVRPVQNLEVTLGGRQSWVDKDFSVDQYFGTASDPFGSVTPFPANLVALGNILGRPLGVAGFRQARRSDAHFSPSVTLAYRFAPDILGYAKYVNGFKAGGFNGLEHTGLPNTLSFEPEYVDAYEVGLRTQFFNRRLTANIALFRSDFRGFQVSAAGANAGGQGVFPVIANAKGARSQGAELEAAWRFNRHFTARFSMTLLDSKFTDFPNAGGSPLDVAQGRPIIDLSGTPTRYAPDYSGNFEIEYVGDLTSSLRFRIAPSLFFSDSYNYSNNNDIFLEQPAYVKLGAQVAVFDAAGRWEASLIGRNLTNERIQNWGTGSGGSYLVSAEEPWSISAQFRVNF